ncbi:hypothetical protein NQ314_011017 [Rhamnusium bicolor]|uniref:Uncharacterized protein n=1 Tax=Rhamnusium bicolor TaxID=1586634 RepID=A0AAV8XLK9_9CUCU|nr:hypothetical protein NQ314_011017 [Rhamnusium bicolor]
MGKLFATKYSDVDHRIFKKSSKKDKCDKKLSIKPQAKPSNESGKSSSLQQIKRKFSTSKENDEPKRKITKTGNVYLPKRPVLLEPGEEKEIIKPITQIVQGSDSDDIRLILKEDNTSDLFFLDELKSSYENYVRKDFSFRIIDEISLEGLDGITIEGKKHFNLYR